MYILLRLRLRLHVHVRVRVRVRVFRRHAIVRMCACVSARACVSVPVIFFWCIDTALTLVWGVWFWV